MGLLGEVGGSNLSGFALGLYSNKGHLCLFYGGKGKTDRQTEILHSYPYSPIQGQTPLNTMELSSAYVRHAWHINIF